ncbi:MAG: glycosyltransferase [Candidatus Hinthialibacter antarcticus]|nr:glycosyltransferase [Candidatus Hinthialibacter antarcticus]
MTDTWVPLHQIQTPNLQNNLQYLQSRSHEAMQWLSNAYESEALTLQQSGASIRCRTADESLWIIGEHNPEQEIATLRSRLRSQAPTEGVWVILGGGVGYGAAEAAAQVIANEGVRVVVIEPTAARLMACFTMVDLRNGLATERLHFSVAAFTPEAVFDVLVSYNLFEHGAITFTASPECEALVDLNSLNAQLDARRGHWRRERESVLASTSRAKPDADVIRNVLIVNCWQNAPGELHLKSIETYLNEWGIKTHWLILNRYRMDAAGREYQRLAEPLLLDAFQRAQPNMVISYGYHAPQFVSEKVYASLPARWVQAVSNIAYYDQTQYPGELCVPIDRNLIPLFERRGYTQCLFQPIMADFVSPEPTPTDNSIPIIMVGNSLALPLAGQQAFWAQWQGRDRLLQAIRNAEKELSDFDADVDFYAYLNENPLPDINHEDEWYSIFRYLLSQGTAARRRAVLEKLAPMGLALFGSDWDAYLPQNSILRRCLKGYLPMTEEPKAFARGSVFVNIHSIGHQTAPNMRYFNVCGMGGFQISDRPQFDEYLTDGTEAVYANSVDDFAGKVKHFLSAKDERDEIRHAAHLRVSKDWTYQNWLENVIKKLGAKTPS